jgi:hypothetical protein
MISGASRYSPATVPPFFRAGKTGWIIAAILVFTVMVMVPAASAQNMVNVVVKNARTGETLGGALVFLDGGYQNETSSPGGTAAVSDVSPGTHTIRVTLSGYNEKTVTFNYPATTTVEVPIAKQALVPLLNANGPSSNTITVVFYPSSTSYSCINNAKLPAPDYITNETLFREDVLNVINNTYMNLDQFTSPADPLPDDYKNYFNFYYYYDPSSPADAFSGCSGSLPDSYWDNVTFSDVTVILYPTYYGRYANTSCQPTGCTQIFGPGHSQMKAPANQERIVRLETGHALFGLDDTFCGDTYYWQNDPYPNVWSSLASCQADAQSHNRDPVQCRQIESEDSPPSCIRNFWQWDPMPDVMAGSYSGRFGDAATQRINYVLSQARVGIQAQLGTGSPSSSSSQSGAG